VYVVATAGHVDHGKSTLLRALTGMEPDRWAEERRRGMTIGLGFVWTTLPGGETVAFVDVPGHERFVTTMLAGVGSVTAALFVVAADEGWREQSAEHLAALDALGVTHCVLAVTRADLADPGPALAEAHEELAATGLRPVAAVAVSAVTGAGLDELRAALEKLVTTLPPPDADGDVRLWADRSFAIRGAGTVVTGTLGQGSVAVGDELELGPGGPAVQVRGIQSLHEPVTRLSAAARAAINLRRVRPAEIGRGQALLTPGAWLACSEVDVRLTGSVAGPAAGLPAWPVLHVGTAAVPVHVRALGADTARLALRWPLPLRIGDRGVLRDPGQRLIRAGLQVLDPRPPALRRRGAAPARAAELAGLTGVPDADGEVARRGALLAADLRRLGVPGRPQRAVASGPWLVAGERWARWKAELTAAAADYARRRPLDAGLPVAAAAQLLGLPDRRLAGALLAELPELAERGGRIAGRDRVTALPPGVDKLVARLADDPFAAPEAAELQELGVTPPVLAAAVRAGLLLDVGAGIYLRPGADDEAVARLAALPQPFTVADARRALGASRRIAVPVLEYLDARRRTRRIDASHRIVR
jgi:selenocysteine-specific elongation factor